MKKHVFKKYSICLKIHDVVYGVYINSECWKPCNIVTGIRTSHYIGGCVVYWLGYSIGLVFRSWDITTTQVNSALHPFGGR